MSHAVRITTIDPGYAQTGGTALACWNRGELVHVKMLRSSLYARSGLALWLALAKDARKEARLTERVVIELPRTYGGRAGKGDANDLIALSTLVGVLAGGFAFEGAEVETISVPKVPKTVTRARVHDALSSEELALIKAAAPPSLLHNVYDAVGIGLRVLKRS